LKTLLNRDEVKRLEGYANAGPSVGSFKIVINRAKRPQYIEVWGMFRPRLRNNPLADLICEAKVIAQRISKSGTLPDWCNSRLPN
jgi:hypothetical protein